MITGNGNESSLNRIFLDVPPVSLIILLVPNAMIAESSLPNREAEPQPFSNLVC